MTQQVRRGFASAEMLVTTLIVVGVVAAIALQKYASIRDGAHVTVMVEDLRHLAASQEAYFADHQTYYGGEVPSPALAFVPSAGVTLKIDAAGATGWSATAVAMGTRRRCSALYGDAGPEGYAAVEHAVCAR